MARQTRRGRRGDGVEAKAVPQLSGRPIFGVRRRLSTSMRTTRRDDVKLLSQQLVPALLKSACLCVAAATRRWHMSYGCAKRQMRAPRGCFTPGCVCNTGFFRRVSRVPTRLVRGRFHTAKNLSPTTLAREPTSRAGVVSADHPFTSINAPRSVNATHPTPQESNKALTYAYM